MASELAIIDPKSATVDQCRTYAITVREVIESLTADQLNELDAILVGVAKRLRDIGKDATEAEKTRTLAMQRYGELLGQAETGRPEKKPSEFTRFSEPEGDDDKDLYEPPPSEPITRPEPLSQAEMDKRTKARLLAEQKDAVAEILAKPKATLNQAITAAKQKRHEQRNTVEATGSALLTIADWRDWLPEQDACDLLLTDPPYSTDVDDVYSFAETWLPEALKKVKTTGRAYVCIGAYPDELHAYLSVPRGDLTLANVLVWTYRNTIGPSPTLDYKLNWQAILYYRGPDAPPLDCPKMTEQFTVQDINAPDGRQGDRYHAWQKPQELGERLIRHSTRPGDLVLDPFSGTGTFLLAARDLGRHGHGCELDPATTRIAAERGCEVADET